MNYFSEYFIWIFKIIGIQRVMGGTLFTFTTLVFLLLYPVFIHNDFYLCFLFPWSILPEDSLLVFFSKNQLLALLIFCILFY